MAKRFGNVPNQRNFAHVLKAEPSEVIVFLRVEVDLGVDILLVEAVSQRVEGEVTTLSVAVLVVRHLLACDSA